MTREVEMDADRIVDAGTEAGRGLWIAIDAANIKREVRTFEVALEVISEEIEDENERALFEASAMKAIPIVMLDAAKRTQIGREFDRAYANYVWALKADQDAAAADWAYDSARDARLLEEVE